MKDKLFIPLGNQRIVARVYDDGYGGPPELSICIEDDHGNVDQDICLVRPHVVLVATDNGDAHLRETLRVDVNRVDCLVYGDSLNEDYTHKHVIDVYQENSP